MKDSTTDHQRTNNKVLSVKMSQNMQSK